MKEKIERLINEIKEFNISSKQELESFRMRFLIKKSVVNEVIDEFKTIPNELKSEVGKLINDLKNTASELYKQKLAAFENDNNLESKELFIDYTLPVDNSQLGARHPINIVKDEIIDIFSRIGFNISEGPEIEDDWHNFTALNFPPNHPARDMQDTFFITDDYALRTHTSSVQVRVMQSQKPPIRTISPGRVYRNEAISARANCFFHQIEGLYIAKDVSFAELKQTLLYFAKQFFGENSKIRLRPSYFPFTEPSAEVDVTCNLCSGKGCNVCKYTGFLEILGCGMVDPNVLENCGIDSNIYSGFAFGMGVERIAMLKYGVNDLRKFFDNNIDFLKQFSSVN